MSNVNLGVFLGMYQPQLRSINIQEGVLTLYGASALSK
jgi:hypothetical protein